MAHHVRLPRFPGCGCAAWRLAPLFVLAGCSQPASISWHQDIIESRLLWAGVIDPDDIAVMCGGQPTDRTPSPTPASEANLDAPGIVFEHVFAALPPCARVYPSERYYYFQTEIAGESVWGNLRLSDIEAGALHMGYYVRNDRACRGSLTLTADDGLSIEPMGESAWRVSYAGKVVVFALFTRPLDVPRRSVVLHPKERVVTGLLDESGYPFALVFDEASSSFYYVLNPDIPLWDTLTPLDDGALLLGREAGFVFLAEEDPVLPDGRRLVLVGVRADSVQQNDYYDGPFDQVPPHLRLRPMLHVAYPYVQYRGGIDESGRFVALEHQRVAISPYQLYAEPGQLAESVRSLRAQGLVDRPLLLALTYEPKRDFHLRLERRTVPRGTRLIDAMHHLLHPPVTWGWPANHWGDESRRWPLTHDAEVSAGWPPNHVPASSAGGGR